jgi:uncharacterized protein (DUF1015 family)
VALIAPFRGVHYPAGRGLSDRLAPPYDVISEREHRRLAASHPHNVVHLTLGSAPAAKRDYRRIGRRLRRWLADGVLVQDPVPAFYAYCQEYVHAGTIERFWGILAALRLEPLGAGRIFPHEQVHGGPVEDRLRIMDGTGANLEPIVAMYRAPSDPMTLLFESLEAQPPALTADFGDGSRHRLWALTAAHTRGRIVRTLRRLPLFIADGHHRYHAAWAYHLRHPRRPEAHWTLSLVANTEQPGLKILPYHRVITAERILENGLPSALARFGRVERVRGVPAPGRHALGFASRSTGAFVLHLPPPPARSSPRDALEVVRLHRLLEEAVPPKEIAFTKDGAEAVAAARRSGRVLACLLPPPTSQQVARVAFSGNTLPRKSTYFVPKPASGLMLRLLR